MRHHAYPLALALGAFAPAAALAQSSVTIYGRVNATVENVQATGSSAANGDFSSRFRVSSNSSRVGFRGVEDLGNGLKAWFQVESAANVDAGGGTWASRNSGVALQGGFGHILFGQWDTPYKVATGRLDPFDNTGIGAYTGIMGLSGSLTAGQGGTNYQQRASFDRRTSNVVQYWSPRAAGFGFRAAYGAPDSDKPPPGPNASITPSLWSALVDYEGGPLYASLAYERHEDYQPLNTLLGVANSTNGTDQGWKIGASYRLGAFTLAGAFEYLDYEGDGLASALVTSLVGPGLQNVEHKMTNFFVAATYETGPHVLALLYAYKSDDELNGRDVSDTSAQQFGFRWGYNFSKRTQVYLVATRINNDSNAFQTFGVNPIGATLPLGLSASRGADPTGYGIGIIHNF